MKWITYISVLLILLTGCASEMPNVANERATTTSAKKSASKDKSSGSQYDKKAASKADSYNKESSEVAEQKNVPPPPEAVFEDAEIIEYEADESIDIVSESVESFEYIGKNESAISSLNYSNSTTKMKAYSDKATQIFNDFVDYLAIISDRDLSKEFRERAVTMSINSFADEAKIRFSDKDSKSIKQFLKQVKKGKIEVPNFEMIIDTNSILTRNEKEGEFICINKDMEVYKIEFEVRKTNKQFGKKTMQVDKVYLTNIELIEK